MKRYILIALAVVFYSTAFSQTQTWTIDKNHSKIGFSVTHMVISSVEGNFKDYESTAETYDNGELKSVQAVIKTKSINTDNDQRDTHLRSDDFFNSDKYPEMKFVSKSIENKGDNTYKITGDLTIRDVTKTVTLDAKLNGKVVDTWGNTRMGWYAQTTIDRFDYNLKWNAVIEAGGLVVGKDVTIKINAEYTLNKQ